MMRQLQLPDPGCSTPPGVGIAVCVALNYLVAYAIFSSSYGSGFLLSDDERSTILWVPLLLGAVVGCIQSLSFGVPTAADFARVHTPPDGPAVLVRVGGEPYLPSKTGRLADVGGCLGSTGATLVPAPGSAPPPVIEDSRAGRAVVIWPPGTTVGSDPYSVSSQGRTYQLGDEVTVGGGWVRLIEADPFYDQTPKTCLASIFTY